MHPSPSQDPFAEILLEHAGIRENMANLRQFLSGLDTQAAGDDSLARSESFTAHMTKLHEKLVQHFREEERPGGALEQLGDRHPRASDRTERFKEEHHEILERIRALLTETLASSENAQPAGSKLSARLGSILDTLARHEREETEFLSRTTSEDIGVGD